MKKLTLLSAVDYETAAAAEKLKGLGFSTSVLHCGIGALAAAKTIGGLLPDLRGRDVIFVGTCGTFGAFDRPVAVTAGKVVWLPTGDRLGASYSVKGCTPEIMLPQPLPELRDLPRRTVVCGPSISLNPTLPASWDPASCVENLELYSVAADIVAVAASVSVVLVVTNTIGQRAHDQWLENREPAAALTAQCLERLSKG